MTRDIFDVIKYLFDIGFTHQNNEALKQAFRFLEQFFIKEFELVHDPIKEIEKVDRLKQIQRERQTEQFDEQLNSMMKASLMKNLENPSKNPMQELLEKEIIKNSLQGKRDIPNTDTQKDDFQIVDKVTDGYGYNSGASLAILKRQKDNINLNRVGLMSGVYPQVTSPTLRAIQEAATKYAVAQAILDNIATVESSLAVRDLFPDIDLLDGRGKPITKREWIQYNNRANRKCNTPADAQAVYQTGKECNNERKVIIIWGFENLGYNKVNSIIMKRSQVKVIDVIDTSNLKFTDYFTGRIRVLKTPILYKARDDARIEFIFDNYVNYTQIRPLAIVVESLGQTMIG